MTPTLIGIAGGTGSGKTAVANKIVESLGPDRAVLVQHDWYYRDRSALTPAERAVINFDEPDALENARLAADLRALRAGQAVACPQYDFATHTRRPEGLHKEPRPVVVVEGILLLAIPEVRDLFDLRLYVETPDDVRLLRRIKRDMLERGRDLASIEAQVMGSVRAMHALHVAPSREHAHLFIPEGGDNVQALDVIVGRLLHGLLHSSPHQS
jgi:uridine kinase